MAPAEPRAAATSLVQAEIVPMSSLMAAGPGASPNREATKGRQVTPPSKLLPARGGRSRAIRTDVVDPLALRHFNKLSRQTPDGTLSDSSMRVFDGLGGVGCDNTARRCSTSANSASTFVRT
jgi:hypothetical protein